jgi:hypothetical protein
MDNHDSGFPFPTAGRMSAFQAARLMMVPLTTSLLLTVVLLIAIPFSQSPHGGVVFMWFVYALVASGVLSSAGIALNAVLDKRETRAGYTTAIGLHRALEQVEPRSGKIIRRAGEPFLTRREYFERRAMLVREDDVTQRNE